MGGRTICIHDDLEEHCAQCERLRRVQAEKERDEARELYAKLQADAGALMKQHVLATASLLVSEATNVNLKKRLRDWVKEPENKKITEVKRFVAENGQTAKVLTVHATGAVSLHFEVKADKDVWYVDPDAGGQLTREEARWLRDALNSMFRG